MTDKTATQGEAVQEVPKRKRGRPEKPEGRKPKPRRPNQHTRARIAKMEAERDALAAEVDALKKGQATALKAAAAAKPEQSAPPVSLVTLGPPPEDPMEAQAWAYKLVTWALHDAVTDKSINARERRDQIHKFSGNLSKLMPDTRRYENERMIREDRADLERKARAKGGAQLVPLPPRPRKGPAGAASS